MPRKVTTMAVGSAAVKLLEQSLQLQGKRLVNSFGRGAAHLKMDWVNTKLTPAVRVCVVMGLFAKSCEKASVLQATSPDFLSERRNRPGTV